MESIYNWIADLGEAIAVSIRLHARAAFWICVALACLWLVRCALLRPRVALAAWFLPAALLVALAGFLFFLPHLGASWRPYQITTELFLLPALALALVGAFLSRSPKTSPQTPTPEPSSSASPFNRTDWLWLAGFLFVGLFLRTYHLADLPRGFLNEYADAAASAIRVLTTGKPFWISTFHAPAWQYMYFMRNPYLYFTDAWALAFWLFGASMTVYRGLVVAIGIGFLATLYFYVRLEFGAIEARIATALATISVWCLALSRDGWPHLMFSPLLFAALLLTWGRALRTAKWSWYAAGTFLLAISLYGYRANYVFPVLVVGQIVFAVLRRRPDCSEAKIPTHREGEERSFLRRHWARLAASAAILALAVLPLLHYIRIRKYFALVSTQAVWGDEPSIQAESSWAKIALKVLCFFGTEAVYARSGQGWRWDMVPTLGGSHGWLFHPLTSALALVGLAIALRFIKNDRYFALLLALVLAPWSGFLSHPITRRLVLILVPMLVLAGIGGRHVLDSLRSAMPARLHRLPVLLFGVVFAPWVPQNAAGFRTILNLPGYTEMLPIAEWTARLIPQHYVYVAVRGANDREYLQFATYQKVRLRHSEPALPFPTPPRSRDGAGRRSEESIFSAAWQLLPFDHITRSTTLHPTGGRPAVFLLQWSPKLHDLNEQLAFWKAAQQTFLPAQAGQEQPPRRSSDSSTPARPAGGSQLLNLPADWHGSSTSMMVNVLPLYPEPEPFLQTRLLMLKVPAQDAPRIPALLERFYRSPQSPGE